MSIKVLLGIIFCALAICSVALFAFFSSEEEQQAKKMPTNLSSQYPAGSLERIALTANRRFQFFLDAQRAYYSINGQFTDNCRQLQSYDQDFDSSFASGDTQYSRTDQCYHLHLLDNGSLRGRVSFAFGYYQRQSFDYLLTEKGLRPLDCQALSSVGCQRGQWSSIGPSSDR